MLAAALADERLRIVASLIRTTGDWDLAEDAVADAGERALRRWTDEGIPTNPAAWLTTTARRRAVDVIRRAALERGKLAEVAMTGDNDVPEVHAVTDDRLRLVFTCCHPALPLEAQVALTLKVVAGLSTEAVGRAFLTSEATMGQRLLRAKRKIAHAAIPYRVPGAEMLPDRLDGVLAVVYLVFTEGWAGDADAPLADEAIRLARLLTDLMPDSDEARGLLALMLLQHSRRAARSVDGVLRTLEQQDRRRWDREAITDGLAILSRTSPTRGRYRIQAELAAAHARAPSAADTDWTAIVRLYDELYARQPTSVVALNRAVAIGMADGPLAGLAALDAIADDPTLERYHPLAAARGELLARAGRVAEADIAFARAAELAPTARERDQIEQRRRDLR